jgi:nitrite reductase/ring-hydroxylating ferredoxin subunit
VLIGDTVQCLWHGSQFDVCTGAVKAGPATDKIEVFETATRGQDITMVAPAAED